jgi:hypothetical protein
MEDTADGDSSESPHSNPSIPEEEMTFIGKVLLGLGRIIAFSPILIPIVLGSLPKGCRPQSDPPKMDKKPIYQTVPASSTVKP